MILGMDWLYIHGTKVDYYENSIEFLDDDGERRILEGNKKHILAIMVIDM